MSRVLELICHSDTPANAVRRVWVALDYSAEGIGLRYSVDRVEALFLAQSALPERARDLWQTTCFELFLRPVGSSGYTEFNFSPSTQWAAYSFDDYREGMADLPCPFPPAVERVAENDAILRVWVDGGDIPDGPLHIGLSAVVEEKDGTKSYWALAHPPGKPDFHDPACFALELPASSRS